MGCPKEAAKCHTRVVRKIVNHIKSASWISKGSICWDKWLKTLGGIGQGSGTRPQSYHSQFLPKSKCKTVQDCLLEIQLVISSYSCGW